MNKLSDTIRDAFIEACHTAGKHGLVSCSSGNMSFRLDSKRFLATASRSWLANLSREQVSLCRLNDGSLLEGPKATVEMGFHAGILRSRPNVNVVLHFQTPFATTLACRADNAINYFVIPEIPVYIGPVATVPYLLPGSQELSEAVVAAAQQHDLVVMSNHGMVTVAKDYAQAIQNAVFFELACEVIVRNQGNLKPLSPEAASDLLALRLAAAKNV